VAANGMYYGASRHNANERQKAWLSALHDCTCRCLLDRLATVKKHLWCGTGLRSTLGVCTEPLKCRH
jgi:hypothetical protein